MTNRPKKDNGLKWAWGVVGFSVAVAVLIGVLASNGINERNAPGTIVTFTPQSTTTTPTVTTTRPAPATTAPPETTAVPTVTVPRFDQTTEPVITVPPLG